LLDCPGSAPIAAADTNPTSGRRIQPIFVGHSRQYSPTKIDGWEPKLAIEWAEVSAGSDGFSDQILPRRRSPASVLFRHVAHGSQASRSVAPRSSPAGKRVSGSRAEADERSVYAHRMARKERWPRSLTQREVGVEITGGFTYSASSPGDMRQSARTAVPPPWLMKPALAVLDDLQAAEPIAGLQIVASPLADLNGLTLGVVEASAVTGELVLIADILQEDLAETGVAWGHARPPCPNHPHPARPVIHDARSWWTCPRDMTPIYRIGRGEVPSGAMPSLTWRKESRRARKRRHH
jgi:hypothetical protein